MDIIIDWIVAYGKFWLILVMAIGALTIIKEIYSKKNGDRFEKKIVKCVKKYIKEDAFCNILIKTGKRWDFTLYDSWKKEPFYESVEETSEIDGAFVSSKGIFVMECKYRSAHINACDGESTWSMGGGAPEENYSPLLQNDKHIQILTQDLERELHTKTYAYNIVVLRAPGTHITLNGTRYHDEPFINALIHRKLGILSLVEKYNYKPRKAFKAFMKEYKLLPDVYSQEEVALISARLKKLQGTKEERKRHANQYHSVEHWTRMQEIDNNYLEKKAKKIKK